jgi:hypothetical protein
VLSVNCNAQKKKVLAVKYSRIAIIHNHQTRDRNAKRKTKEKR